MKGYEDITGHIYKAPEGGFVLPSGVAMYGGFAGNETIKNDLPTGRHKYQMKYQTALVGDIDTNDKASQQLIIYPENTTRTDNATHVLTLQMGVTQDNTNDGNKPTIVSGFLIAAGNASGANTSANGRGGGIYVVNSNDGNAQSRFFRISQCNFANNYGMRGGAIYVDNSCTNQLSAISYCSIFNNVAGKRGSSENEGGGMWIDGTATVYNCNINNNTNGGIRLSSTSKIVNCSVIANTVSAADLTTDGASNSIDGGAVYNSVLWHSTALSKQDSRPAFYSCAFPEVEVTHTDTNTDANGNVRISNENHGIEPAPWFKQSAVTQGYDFSFSSNLKQLYSTAFTFEETSALLNKGKLEYYTNNVVNANLETTSTDIMGRTRYQTSTIDIGAYEYARMKAGRIRYVKPKKAGKGDGTSWDDATDDIQWAINDLAENAPGEKGEVWVAAGTYVVKDRITDDTSSPVSLLMKNGISVYGAFKGTEKRRSERIEESKDLKPWGWKQESIIRGAEFKGSDDANWSNNDEAWNIQNSGSYHVVWFAPLPGGNAFTDEVYLEGFTIEGGKFHDTNKAEYAPGCGAGVYINDPSARMRYCTVRFCNPGMKKTTNTQPRGGGIYCRNGQTEGNLVYNCSAYQGGGIYIDEAGFITRSMVTNCSAYQGAGVYLNGDANNSEKAYYQILATSVISNNTSTRNGAVYLDGHGLVINNTIVNNYTTNTSDAADELSSNTGGVYIKKKGLLANNVIWNNSLLRHKSGTSNSASMAQIYAANPSEETVQFYNNAISDVNAAKWTSTYQSGTISINTYYSGKGFEMGKEAPYNTVEAFNEKRGVLTDMKTVNYYWETLTGSRLRNVGISYALLPSSYLYQPKIDLSGKAISSVPSAGAYMADNHDLVFEKNDSKKRLRIYFDRSRELVDGTGQSWEKSYTSSSVDEVLGYLADIKDGEKVQVVTADNTTPEEFNISKNSGWEFEICSREGVFEPKIAYKCEETDARSCTFSIPPCILPITVYGGYPGYSENPNPKDEDRAPIKYRTELNGNLNGSDLNEGLYHLVRIEAGANITIDGYAFTHAYAAGTAYMPYGGGVLIGSMDQSSQATTVKLKNCIFENNTATNGGAIATMPDAVNVKLELENCVINNNTSKDPHNQNPSELPSIIYLSKGQNSNNSLTLNHVSIINNEGVAPDNDLMKATSYAVGNKLNINGTWEGSECKNSMDINTLGKDGALNFSNPTNEVGAKMSGNVYYGGYSSFRPLTSSLQAGRIINSAQESNATTTAKDITSEDRIINSVQESNATTPAKDITGEDRNLGGVPDLGAYEALLPKAGKIIYVRSYNQNYESSSDANNDDQDGNPNFNLLKESKTEYDGSSWDKAIIGNAMCDNTKGRTGNEFYVKQSDNTLLSTTIDNTDYSKTNGEYRSKIDSYGNFWTNSGNQDKQYLSGWGSYNKITNNRDERYISGLQYAVERAAELNKIKKDSVVVWVGAGIYTDYKGFVVRDKVEVIGGFPYEGYPGENDRHPLLSQYVPARKEYENLDKTKYETILQIRKESPVYFTDSSKEMWYQEDKPKDGSKYGYTKKLMNSGETERHYVLYQPDVCLPTWSPSGDGNATRTDGNAVRYKGNLKDNKYYKDYEYAKWDGFSVRHGYIINYPGANRDGGAGVRVFRGVELENLIIVNNFNHGSRVRGGGLYMDGEITGKERTMTKQQTAGAYTSDLPAFDNTKLLKRLFVSQTGGEIVTEEEKAKYYGRSFLTPFNSLEAALDYINEAREKKVANDKTHFEILMTGGTYKPSKMRQNKDLSPEQNTIDRRLQSFTIPVNVDIFGSFSKDDLYSSTPVNPTTGEEAGDKFTSFGGNTLTPDGDIKDILANRNKNYMTDNNKNGLIEPWEFQNPTILSGDIKASEKERNVYHVVYSNAGTTGTSATLNNEVVLDGITIMNGETMTQLKKEEGGTNEVAEIGRGGAIYTNRVNYTLNRCRLIKNSGLHGGAIYANNASLDIIGSTISGNRDVSEKASQDVITEPGKGGAIYLYLTESENGNLHIVNSLLANNDVTCGRYTGTEVSQGGAIYIRRANDAGSMAAGYQDAYIVNNLIVNNKAKQDGAIHVENEVKNGTITPILYNTAIWGNESTDNSVLLQREHMRNCAWDELPASTVSPATDGNIKLNKENIASDGPRFTAPTTTKGYEGYTQDAKWNPQAISVLTDAGDGKKDADDTNESGKYQKWWSMHNNRLKEYGYRSEYIRSANSSKEYYRYVGPKDEKGVVREKPIDIGMYEFQYVFKFTDLEKVYIGTEEKGNGDGSSWDNQSTDLRGAIIAMANPSGNVAAGTTTNNNRKVFVRGGTYYSPTYSSGDAFSLIVNNDEKAKYITSIELVGGCTGSKNADGTEVQDFSKPSVLIENPAKAGETTNLLNIVTNGKPVTISGFTFQNQNGVGVKALINKDNGGKGSLLKVHHSAFRHNSGVGMYVDNSLGCGIKMWNVLFADGKAAGLTISGSQSADITNATFVNNIGRGVQGTGSIYNSLTWNNGDNTIKDNDTKNEANNDIAFPANTENGDVLNGPNFVDPNNGDYRIRPSLMLLDKGSNERYQLNADINSEKDLGNTARLIGDNIDIGAYECDTKMIQVIYVKEGSAIAGTGESWDNPTNDLQGAINLAELYANKNEGEYGYVFVDRNLKADNVNISMPGVKMFGSMRGETSSATGTENIVKDLLSQRKGIIESSSQSTINGLTLNSGTTDTRMCLVDGFKVSGAVSIQGNSMLSTSIIDGNISGDANGMLYNSLALGSVEKVKSVNVTAAKALPEISGSAANRSPVTTYNKYVKDEYWKYQLDETDNDNINQHDANVDGNPTKACTVQVMHNHDLAGNQRIRDNVDKGCFETWYLTNDATANQDDYPHGKSVVYVMTEDKELKLDNTFYTETNPFTPGFLLLKHHAGLRGNNSYVNLTNFAVERNLKAGTNFFSMPFKATNMEVEGTDKPADGSVIAYYYNAATRAKYDYKFDQSESKAWVRGVDNQRNFTAGFRMDANGNKTVRFYGISYTEKDGRTNRSLLDKITMVQNNNQQPWSDSNGGGLKFTHKENMGWNLFGSPYLCAMNYSDMEYGRVIYQCEENGSYKAINTYDLATGVSTDGYIPAMDAAFTQTATLDNSESVIVEHSEARATTAYQAIRALDIAITQSNRNSRAGNSAPVDDQLQLNTVPAQEAKSDFDLGSDGVKWMTSQNAQIYANRNGGRYSLLSAVSIEAEQSIGISLPETGEYTISIPEDCDASEYETVWLKDKETGKAIDLKEGDYRFHASQAGEQNHRFTISFNRLDADMKSDISIQAIGFRTIVLKGLQPNDLISVYAADGVLALQKKAKAEKEQVRTAIQGNVIVEVTRGGKQVAVRKIALK